MIEPFDMERTPLRTGVTLLEASAGTGKTYTIEGLFLRLVAELGIPVREILVCTFTNAATKELRERIRERLRAARESLRDGRADDPAVKAALSAVGDSMTVRLRLAQALAGFDEARIFTIHGFCNRVLTEHSFESGGAFDRVLSEDSSRYVALAARDFVRRETAALPLVSLCLFMSSGKLEPDCVAALNKRGADRDTQLRPNPGPGEELSAIEVRLASLLDAFRVAWLAEDALVDAFVRDESKVKAPLYNKAEVIVRGAREFAEGGPVSSGFISATVHLARTNIEDQAKKKIIPPDLAVFRVSQQIQEAIASARTELLRQFLSQADSLLEKLHSQTGTMDCDDLLYETAVALRESGPASLSALLSRRYRVAMVDEFQDTDRLQWEIFETLFANHAHHLYLIGDPKQSIYRFRGADVHAYMDAASCAGNTYTLDTNWRSDAPVVAAVNAVFSRRRAAFGLDGIDFSPVKASGRVEPTRVFQAGPELQQEPVRFVLCGMEDPGNAPAREKWILGNLSADIRALLDSGATLGGSPVCGGDIAVIVRKHWQGGLVKTALASVGVQAVDDTGKSVFDSPEAGAFEDFLSAMLRPDDPRLIRWVLAGPFFGLNASDIVAFGCDDAAWESWTFRLSRFRGMWEKRGFMPAFRALDSDTGLRSRLASLPEGERVLTNILHLAELLNTAEREGKLPPERLLKWLSLMRAEPDSRPADVHTMRLESDAKAVRIITSHKSKGLEFPVVFMPFALDKPHAPGRFIATRENGRPVLWLPSAAGVPDEVAGAEGHEDLCERIRLLYVSLTRARNRCVVYLVDDGLDKNASEVALPYVLGATGWTGLKNALTDLAAALPEAVSVESRMTAPELVPSGAEVVRPELSSRRFLHSVEVTPMLTSFSALHGGPSHALPDDAAVEQPERLDGVASADAPELALTGIAAFPKGAAVGTFFHACLEKMNYADPFSWREEVARQLKAAGIPGQWLDTALATLGDTLETPLCPDGPVLAGKPQSDLVREGEFYFSARGPDMSKLARAFAAGGAPLAGCAEKLVRMEPGQVNGYLKGYVDLVFREGGRYCILDWKSNWLGPSVASYTPSALDAAMRASDYYLQGALYAVALRRSMAARWRDWDYMKHFGGVYYVFLRGVDRTPGRGVVFFRPEAAVLDGIEEALGMGGALR